MKANEKTIRPMAKAFMFILMGMFIQATEKMTNNMALELKNLKMEDGFRATLIMEKNMGMEKWSGQTETSGEGHGKMENSMEEESSYAMG